MGGVTRYYLYDISFELVFIDQVGPGRLRPSFPMTDRVDPVVPSSGPTATRPDFADNGQRPSVAEWPITGILDLNAGLIRAHVTDHRRNNASSKLS